MITNIPFKVSVVDNITGMGVTAKITLMTADSVVIDTITADIEEMPWDIGYHKAYYEFKDAVTSKGKYIIKAEKEGYDVLLYELRIAKLS